MEAPLITYQDLHELLIQQGWTPTSHHWPHQASAHGGAGKEHIVVHVFALATFPAVAMYDDLHSGKQFIESCDKAPFIIRPLDAAIFLIENVRPLDTQAALDFMPPKS